MMRRKKSESNCHSFSVTYPCSKQYFSRSVTKMHIFKVSKPGHKQRAVIPHFYSVEKSIEKKKLTIDGEK